MFFLYILVLLFKRNDLSKDNEILWRFGALHRGPSFALGQSTCHTEGLHCGLEAHWSILNRFEICWKPGETCCVLTKKSILDFGISSVFIVFCGSRPERILVKPAHLGWCVGLGALEFHESHKMLDGFKTGWSFSGRWDLPWLPRSRMHSVFGEVLDFLLCDPEAG